MTRTGLSGLMFTKSVSICTRSPGVLALRPLGRRRGGTRIDRHLLGHDDIVDVGLGHHMVDRASEIGIVDDMGLRAAHLGGEARPFRADESGAARFEEAVAAYRERSLAGANPRAPLDWAQTQEYLALVYRALFAKTGSRVHLEDALAAVGGALEKYNKAKAASYIEKAGRLRAELLAMKGNPRNRTGK